MAVEIERKFLLRDERWRAEVHHSMQIRQGYLNHDVTHCSVRVRVSGEDAWLNIKGAVLGAQRPEYEYPIPLIDATELLDQLCRKPLIEKTRHLVNYARQLWEIDEFHGDNAGLIVAEAELQHPDQPLVLPDWAGEEVTMDLRYYNTSLSKVPFNQW